MIPLHNIIWSDIENENKNSQKTVFYRSNIVNNDCSKNDRNYHSKFERLK